MTAGLRFVAGSRARARRHARPAGRAVPPAGHPVLFVNPRSGDGTAERVGLEPECRVRGVEPVVLGPGEDLVALAETAVARGADVIGMAGGDGSMAFGPAVERAVDLAEVNGRPFVDNVSLGLYAQIVRSPGYREPRWRRR